MIKNISRKTIIIAILAILLIGLGIGGYLCWNNWKKSKEAVTKSLEAAGEAARIITENATKGVLPSIETNPLENKPDINPADNANPFKDLKINPFE